MLTDFREFLAALITQVGGTKADFASKVGLSQSGLSHLLNGHHPSVDVCLRVAEAVDESPTKILRLAGKADIARVLESLYGGGAGHRRPKRAILSPTDELFLERWKSLPQADRLAVKTIVVGLFKRRHPHLVERRGHSAADDAWTPPVPRVITQQARTRRRAG